MEKSYEIRRSIIDMDMLPDQFPTHLHSAHFWEQLGRTIATFGFLEEVLAKAVFALTATRKYSPEEVDEAYSLWLPSLEKALTSQLYSLADQYEKAAWSYPNFTTENVDVLVGAIKEVSQIRNVLCHGSWQNPDEEGRSLPFFVNRHKKKFESLVDIAYLKQVQRHTMELSCGVINSVTHMGWQFPGSNGAGIPIY